MQARQSREFLLTKQFMYREPAVFGLLLDKLATVMAEYVSAQVAAGAHAFQVFDSWVGALSPADYEARVLPYTRRIFEATRGLGVPTIHFGTSTPGRLEPIPTPAADFIPLDCPVPPDAGWQRIAH